MDSSLIYKTGKHLASTINWENQPEWIYCGLSGDFKTDLVMEQLQLHFQNASLYIVLDRSLSRQLRQEEAITIIKEYIDKTNFVLWNSNFSKAMEFSNIGVFRLGTCSANIDLNR